MATLNIASKAHQATTVPALVVAQYANEADPNASISINFEEVEELRSGDKAAVELIVGSGSSFYGFEHAIGGLVEAYPFLQGKNEKSVRGDSHSDRTMQS